MSGAQSTSKGTGTAEAINGLFQVAKYKVRGRVRFETMRTVPFLLARERDFEKINPNAAPPEIKYSHKRVRSIPAARTCADLKSDLGHALQVPNHGWVACATSDKLGAKPSAQLFPVLEHVANAGHDAGLIHSHAYAIASTD